MSHQTTTRPALAVGQTFSYKTDRYTVTLTSELIAGRPVFKVATASGSVIGQPVDQLTVSFGTELVARLVARRIAECLSVGANVDTTRDAVYATVQILLAGEVGAPSINAPVVVDLQLAVDVFMPGPARNAAQATAAQLNADLDARAARRTPAPLPSADPYEWARLRAARAGVTR